MSRSPAPALPAITVGLRPFGVGSSIPGGASLLVTISALPGGGVHFGYRLEGGIEALCVPEARTPDPWPLWQHTCFEAFLCVSGEARYREYNFSPAGLWAASEFRRYRELDHEIGRATGGGDEGEGEGGVIVSSARSEDVLTLAAEVPAALLPGGPLLRVGLSAVIEYADGQREYWAVHHPAEQPDFHHAGGWVVQLDTQLGAQ